MAILTAAEKPWRGLRLSIRMRALLMASLAITVVLFTNAYVRQREIVRLGRAALHQRAAQLVSIEANGLSVPVAAHDSIQIGAALDSLAADPEFVEIRIDGPDGTVLADRRASWYDTNGRGDNELVTAAAPIRYLLGGKITKLATLELALSGRRMALALQAERQDMLRSLLLLLGAVLATVYLALRAVTEPLRELEGALDRLAAGDRDTPIPALNHFDEVGAVARALAVFRDTTTRLIEVENEYRVLVDHAAIGIYRLSADGALVSANAGLLRILGYASQDDLAAAMAGERGHSVYVAPSHQYYLASLRQTAGGFLNEIAEMIRADMTTLWVAQTEQAVHDGAGRLLGFAGTLEDVTERRRRHGEERMRVRAAMESTSDAILITDEFGATIFTNPAFGAIFGMSAAEVTQAGGLPDMLLDSAKGQALRRAIEFGAGWSCEADVLSGGGDVVPMMIRASTIHDERGSVIGSVVLCSDLSDHRVAEERLHHLAHHDSLTGLPNRLGVVSRLTAALRESGGGAVLYLNVNRFKDVNDAFGHPAGDALLRMAADRLRLATRTDDTVARVGGDEFVVVQASARTIDAVETLVARLLGDLSKPFELEGREVLIDISIGVALFPAHGAEPDRLMRYAHLALTAARAGGRRQWRLFQPALEDMLRQRTEMEQDLRRAVAEQRLHLAFQPQFDLATGTLVGAEALLRWTDPVRGEVPPNEFIPLAEESGLICDLGLWALQEACGAAASWPGQLRVAVNLSSLQLRGDSPLLVLADILAESGLPPSRLELEITESVLLNDPEAELGALGELKRAGVRIALDDFGTGYSSLSYLRRMRIDKIKIDRSFVGALGRDEAALALVRSIIGIGRQLNIQINAEGVETEEQARLLRQEGCAEVQGFLFAKPMGATEFARMLERIYYNRDIASVA
jgi:diguanylate cyclase (GGDEF)-like protein/PAS domain S-box-containing protein